MEINATNGLSRVLVLVPGEHRRVRVVLPPNTDVRRLEMTLAPSGSPAAPLAVTWEGDCAVIAVPKDAVPGHAKIAVLDAGAEVTTIPAIIIDRRHAAAAGFREENM